MYIYLYIYIYTYLSIYLSFFLSIYLSIYLSICWYIYLCIFIYVFIHAHTHTIYIYISLSLRGHRVSVCARAFLFMKLANMTYALRDPKLLYSCESCCRPSSHLQERCTRCPDSKIQLKSFVALPPRKRLTKCKRCSSDFPHTIPSTCPGKAPVRKQMSFRFLPLMRTLSPRKRFNSSIFACEREITELSSFMASSTTSLFLGIWQYIMMQKQIFSKTLGLSLAPHFANNATRLNRHAHDSTRLYIVVPIWKF